jgi:predicted RNA-binding Zn-ribbon protein involved in translation (DUF1610 family)
MVETDKNKGPWSHRILVGIFTILFSILIFWLLDFAMDDIGSIQGPDYKAVERGILSPTLVSQLDAINRQITEVNDTIHAQTERQTLLRDSTGRSEATLRQLLDLQRTNAQKGVATGDQQQRALAESVTLFLSNQQRDQAIYDDIVKLSERERQLQAERQRVDAGLEVEREQARQQFDVLERRHNRKLAFFKLLLLIPLLGAVLFLVVRKRAGIYAPVAYAAAVAILAQTVLVIHEHFPTRYFKYIVLGAALLAVGYSLVWLIRMVRRPKASWLLKQYREAYQTFFCPVCDYPIRRGPRRYLFWTRRTIRNPAPQLAESQSDQSYTCPACGSRLYEPCAKCNATRHSLLPYCDNCGAEKTLELVS